MPADRLLTTVLRAYHDVPNPVETDKIYGTTTTLLTNLNNPLNLSLLTSHFLTARSIWQAPDGLRTCLRIISVYNTAAIHVGKNELENANNPRGGLPVGSGVSSEDWARAIAKGADDRSSRWQHMLVLTGVLMGMEGDDRRSLSWSLRSMLEKAVATAANLALLNPQESGPLGRGAVVLALTYAVPLLSESAKQLLNGNVLLPAIIEAMLGDEGFQHGDFISSIMRDITPGKIISWRTNSHSVTRLQILENRPLTQNMGPLSRLVPFAVQHTADPNIILQAQKDLFDFTVGLLDKWSHCPLSAIDLSVEVAALSLETLQGPHLRLWQLFKKIMYAVVASLQPIVGRCLLDPFMRNDMIAPTVASKTLHTLRNLSFISTRQGAGSFQVYEFTYLTSLDIITRYPDACMSFLQDTQPPSPTASNVVPSPTIQALSLFYLNTAEHLPFSLPTPACENLIISPATAYLSPTTSWLSSPANLPPSSLTLELFESAHSSVLSALSCPQHSPLAASLIPFYIDALLSSFPSRISPRQFRLAFRTVMQITSPPFPISATEPELSEALLETLRFRAIDASTQPLLPLNEQATPAPGTKKEDQGPVSEQTALVLAIIDSLPHLPLYAIEEWLTRTAESMNAIADPAMRDLARRRFWDVLVSGEMDVERGAVGVAWWGTNGGREMVLFGQPRAAGGEFLMSGALVEQPREGSQM
ncbi:peroxin 8 [Annulohypoxylon maeteangense]|uniref:peroxin 8 n=1 Tax=Annulohypoxylon maeteangense TaxID=1927788 RepID=UPI002008E8F8|nr:peroxin 8 [Annulohypoxylon maeteangense]KAI0887307.1 peroxin 8 [Annulohypoxylon maeteangense]